MVKAACSTFTLDIRSRRTHLQQAAARSTEDHEHSSSSGRAWGLQARQQRQRTRSKDAFLAPRMYATMQ